MGSKDKMMLWMMVNTMKKICRLVGQRVPSGGGTFKMGKKGYFGSRKHELRPKL